MGSNAVLMLGHTKRRLEGLGVKSRSHHHVEWGNWAREATRKQQEAKQDDVATERQRNLSKEQAKQDQTTTTASEPSVPLPHRDPQTLQIQ